MYLVGIDNRSKNESGNFLECRIWLNFSKKKKKKKKLRGR